MVRSKSDVWNYFEIEGNKVTCKFCQKEAFKNPSRMPVHLVKCSKCPDSVKVKMSCTISKSCVSLCKKTPIYKSIESRLETSRDPLLVESSDMQEERDFDHIDDIEVLSEEDIDTNRVPSSEDIYKYISTERGNDSWNAKSRLTDVDRSFMKRSDEVVVDEFSIFGDCVAHKLRNISNPRARAIAQYYINTVLFRAEMTNFKEDVPCTSAQEFKLFDAVQVQVNSELEDHN